MSYTKGPWEVATSCSWRRIVNARMEPVCIPVIQHADNHPDLLFPNGGPEGPDANLIAAAPDLVETLRDVTYQLRMIVEGHRESLMGTEEKSANDAIKKSEQVVAKAEGKS